MRRDEKHGEESEQGRVKRTGAVSKAAKQGFEAGLLFFCFQFSQYDRRHEIDVLVPSRANHGRGQRFEAKRRRRAVPKSKAASAAKAMVETFQTVS